MPWEKVCLALLLGFVSLSAHAQSTTPARLYPAETAEVAAQIERAKQAVDAGRYKEAIEIYERLVDSNARAQNNLGTLYLNGQGVAADAAKAVSLYRRAAEANVAVAKFNLAILFSSGNGVAKDHDEAAKWCRGAAEQGLAPAQSALGRIYATGQGVPQSHADSVAWHRKAAAQGDLDGEFGLGSAYAFGNGVTRDLAEAAKWYRRAANQGHSVAQYNLAEQLSNGNGVPRNDAEAVTWYRKSAEQGHAAAQYQMGRAYYFGIAVEKDLAQTVVWWRKAIQQNHAGAQADLGLMLLQGTGVQKNGAEGADLIRRAAILGLARAQFNLALMIIDGTEFVGTPALAAEWARKAADQNLPEAQYWLAMAHRSGNGVAVDASESARWMKRAADNGHAKAQRELADGATRVASVEITPAQLEAAQPKMAAQLKQQVAQISYETGVLYLQGGDQASAMQSFREAADANHRDAQYRLARIYLEGDGVPKDVAAGNAWMKRAADNGQPEAVKAMREQASTRTDTPRPRKFPFQLAGLSPENKHAVAAMYYGAPRAPAKDGHVSWRLGEGLLFIGYNQSTHRITSVSVSHPDAVRAIRKVGFTDPTLDFIGMHKSDVIAALGQPVEVDGGEMEWEYKANGETISATVTCYDEDNPQIARVRKDICYAVSVFWPSSGP
jgi:TPR repeat protein